HVERGGWLMLDHVGRPVEDLDAAHREYDPVRALTHRPQQPARTWRQSIFAYAEHPLKIGARAPRRRPLPNRVAVDLLAERFCRLDHPPRPWRDVDRYRREKPALGRTLGIDVVVDEECHPRFEISAPAPHGAGSRPRSPAKGNLDHAAGRVMGSPK